MDTGQGYFLESSSGEPVAKGILYKGVRQKEREQGALSGKVGTNQRGKALSSFLSLTEGMVGERGGCYQGRGEKLRRGKMKRRGRKAGKSQNAEGSTPLSCIFIFSHSFLFLHTLTILKKKCQTFRIHTSKKSPCSLLPKLPFSCSRVACHLASNIPLCA